MELALAFWLSLALLFCIILCGSAWRVMNDDELYQMGIRHGREQAAMEMRRKTYDIDGTLPMEEESGDDQ